MYKFQIGRPITNIVEAYKEIDKLNELGVNYEIFQPYKNSWIFLWTLQDLLKFRQDIMYAEPYERPEFIKVVEIENGKIHTVFKHELYIALREYPFKPLTGGYIKILLYDYDGDHTYVKYSLYDDELYVTDWTGDCIDNDQRRRRMVKRYGIEPVN